MKKLFAVIMAASFIIMAFPQTIYADYVGRGTHRAYIFGYPDGTVRPEEYMTREEAASILCGVFGDELDNDGYIISAFDDVSADRWSFEAINCLYLNGVVSGNGGSFRPEDKITRAEMASMIYRLSDEKFGSRDFNDTEGHWAEKYIETVAAEGWIAGYSDGSFRPDEKITRSEAVFLINKVLDREPENKEALLNDMKVFKDNTDETKWYYLAIQEASNSHEYSRKDNGFEVWNLVTEEIKRPVI